MDWFAYRTACLVAALALVGCGPGFESGADGGSAGASSNGGGGAGNAGSGGSGGSGGGGTGGDDAVCPSGLPGPELVTVPGPAGPFCVDATEVTTLHYRAFLDAGVEPPADPLCSWKSGHEPAVNIAECLAKHGDHINYPDDPVTCVDWCDARAYCQWAGKRLCGGVGGTALSYDDYADPQRSEWMFACSQGGARVFPYGDVYDAAVCVGDEQDGSIDQGAGEPQPVGSSDGCEGGFPGLFDMSGNVWEWEDSCIDDATPADDLCQHRGGSFWDAGMYLDCAEGGFYTRDFRNKNFGFRCCADTIMSVDR